MKREQPERSYKLAFIDLDDTLLGPTKHIHRANLGALKRLRRAGVQIAIASGRHHKNITGLREIGQQEWVLSSHGSVVRHEQTGEILAEETIAPALVDRLCARARELDFTLIVYHRDGAFIERDSEWTHLYARNAGWLPIREDFHNLDPAAFQKVLWSDHSDRITEWAPKLKTEFADHLNVLATNPELLEFFSLNANKAVGAQTLARKLGIKPEETLAFGDGSNDVELLRWAGFSVAMNHGQETARRAARMVSPPGPPESAFARAVNLTLSAAG